MSDGLGPSGSKLQAQPKGMPNAACSGDLDKTACFRHQSKAHGYSSPVVACDQQHRALIACAKHGLDGWTVQVLAHAIDERANIDLEAVPRRLGGSLDLLRAMRKARRNVIDQYVVADHFLKEQGTEFGRLNPISILAGKIRAAWIAEGLEMIRKAGIPRRGIEALNQSFAGLPYALNDGLLAIGLDHCARGGERVRFGTVRS